MIADREDLTVIENIRVCDIQESKRILITNVNGLLGHGLFEQMRNDHLKFKHQDEDPHRFLGTINRASDETPVPSEAIKLLDYKSKPKTFDKQVRAAEADAKAQDLANDPHNKNA